MSDFNKYLNKINKKPIQESWADNEIKSFKTKKIINEDVYFLQSQVYKILDRIKIIESKLGIENNEDEFDDDDEDFNEFAH